jgi:Immunity protein Imm1
MPPSEPGTLVVTASLTNGVARVTHGLRESVALIDEILALNHTAWETTLSVGDIEFYQTKEGPFPNNQMRVSVNPGADRAALNYTANDYPAMPIANSFNATELPSSVDLIFNGTTGAIFPRMAAISIHDARRALNEWLQTRRRPTCIEWRPYDENDTRRR